MNMTKGSNNILKFSRIILFLIILSSCLIFGSVTAQNLDSENYSAVESNEKYWIVIDPIPDAKIGDIISVHGTTNLSVGENLTIKMYGSNCFHSQQHITSCRYFGPIITVVKMSPSGNTNFFLTNINTSGHKPDVYDVGIGSEPGKDLLGEPIQWNLTENLSNHSGEIQAIHSDLPVNFSEANRNDTKLITSPVASFEPLSFVLIGLFFVLIKMAKRIK